MDEKNKKRNQRKMNKKSKVSVNNRNTLFNYLYAHMYFNILWHTM